MNQKTTAYFDDLLQRASCAPIVARMPAEFAKANDCHANCERFVQVHQGHRIVRGWLVVGGHLFIPHSIIRNRLSGDLTDVTPDLANSGAIPFVEHIGSEEDFSVLRVGRDGGWIYPQPSPAI